jgi:hypothetical protein
VLRPLSLSLFLALALSLLPSSARAADPAIPARDDGREAVASLTGLVVAALSAESSFEVVASEDVRKQMELEAERQTAGCEAASTSCLAEIAGALGARVVVYGSLGQLGETLVLTLNLFDSSDPSASGRAVVRETTIDLVANGVTPAVRELVAAYRRTHPAVEGARERALVLDLEGTYTPPTPPEKENTLLVPGIAAAGAGALFGVAGAVLLVVSGLAHAEATAPATLQKDVPGAYDRRDVTGWVGTAVSALGVVGIGAGIALVVLGGGE